MLGPIAEISKDFEKTFNVSSDKVGEKLTAMFTDVSGTAREMFAKGIDDTTNALRKGAAQATETGNMFDQAAASNAAEVARLSEARRQASDDVDKGLQKDQEQVRVLDRLPVMKLSLHA